MLKQYILFWFTLCLAGMKAATAISVSQLPGEPSRAYIADQSTTPQEAFNANTRIYYESHQTI
jgi:hypothetical protein